MSDGTATLTVDVTWNDRSAMAAVGGDVDLASAPTLARYMAQARKQHPRHVVLDFGGVTFADCAGARAVLAAVRSFPVDCHVIVRNTSPAIQRIFAITGLAASWPEGAAVLRRAPLSRGPYRFGARHLSVAHAGSQGGTARRRETTMTGGPRSQRKAAVHLFRFRALVTLDSWKKTFPPGLDPSSTHELMVHAWRPSGPPGGKYLPAAITRDDGQPLQSGESQVVTITVTDDDAPLLLAPGEPFTIWGGASGSGIVSRRVFTTSGPS